MFPREKSSKACRILGVEFAPLSMPMERRLQTMALAFFFSSFMLTLFSIIPAFMYILIFTRFWYIPVLFAAWIFYDRNTPYQGGRKIYFLRNLRIWDYYRDYFPVGLVKTAELPADKNYIFCVYPHGIVSAASFLNFQSNANNFDELFPGIDTRIVVLNSNFKIPIAREFYLAAGGIPATEQSMIYCLQSKPGASCVLMPGGAREALSSFPGQCSTILKNRRGFVRIALKTGSSLVPVYSFGENEIFDQISGKWVTWLQNKLVSFLGLAPCLLKGRGFFQYSFGLLPHRRPIVTVVGKPIDVPKDPNPSKELIDEFHEKYEEALVELFDENKEKFHPLGSKAALQIE
ncbi:hypothetical protein V9T40_006302 [Parthenolecanium corni]|uniref:Acyltransferase n=1 Tax=Parthenolecanium corni TaxID=536013 RepID=A0AAN9TP88_9HEMI